MSVITLISDWGLKDHYLGAVKGKLLKLLPETQLIDISHQIEPFNSMQAAFVLKNAWHNFPKGSVHILAVNTEESDKYPHCIIEVDGHYFIGTDNGTFSLIFDKNPSRIIELDIVQDSNYFTFSTYDRFIKVAVELINGSEPESLGNIREKLVERISFNPVTEGNVLKGMVIYIDNYQNVITNITEEKFKAFGKNRKFEIHLRGEILTGIHTSYSDVPEGEIVALFGTHGHLEIAINKGNASSLLGLYLDKIIRIEFTS
ncbi:MAG: SAM-dependent chlorinase/fluorinase [Bacteroidales bacterium]|nr:SAM-dependent chlorinase/fluorinase [Bacteroidales bacterium]MCF8386595.1 SAM-dependent chlorinase/fluorinase [Bacteroidales bacterium]MCF8398141.1 SAM-dependent chlorinase/fluorinase [Bacteroidales bacterium]